MDFRELLSKLRRYLYLYKFCWNEYCLLRSVPICALIVVLYSLLQLDEMLKNRGVKVDKVLNFAIDDRILEERITGRWIHPSSGRSYHTKFAPPKVPGVDDVRRP